MNHLERWVPLSPLQEADVGAVEAGRISERLLAEPGGFPPGPNDPPELPLKLPLGHRPERYGPVTIGLQTIVCDADVNASGGQGRG